MEGAAAADVEETQTKSKQIIHMWTGSMADYFQH